jgi:hypothetical protein
MFSGIKRWIKYLFAALCLLILISAVTAGHITHQVLTDISVWWHTSGIHSPKVTPPKLHG